MYIRGPIQRGYPLNVWIGPHFDLLHSFRFGSIWREDLAQRDSLSTVVVAKRAGMHWFSLLGVGAG